MPKQHPICEDENDDLHVSSLPDLATQFTGASSAVLPLLNGVCISSVPVDRSCDLRRANCDKQRAGAAAL